MQKVYNIEKKKSFFQILSNFTKLNVDALKRL